MEVHLFRTTGRVFGFTPDRTRANLPVERGAWTPFGPVEMTRGEPIPGVEVDERLDDIEGHGFHVPDAHVRITERYV